MKRIRKFLKSEDGAYQMIEAVLIYPIVFLIIFVLIFIGIYILQLMTMSAYAQKIAMLAAREVSCPGYHDVLNQERYTTTAVEADFGTTEEGKSPFEGKVNIDNKVENVQLRAYRYWSSSPLNSDEKGYYEGVLETLVKNNSLINASKAKKVDATIECKNYVISQFITVTVEQELMDIELLEYFGVESPKLSVKAVSTVSDADELVRTTDFAADAIEAIAQKFGIDTNKIKSTVQGGMEKLGLTY